jgi:hypothetical protein
MHEPNAPETELTIQQLVHEAIVKLLESVGDNAESIQPLVAQAIDSVANSLFDSISGLANDHVKELRDDLDGFEARQQARWGRGLEWLHLHRHYCIKAGQQFQSEFLKHEQFVHDPLLGVLIRLHAHACRIQGEIITLLAAGYPDGAFARWRTLHEIAATAIVLRDAGENAATDYLQFGIVQAVNGMNGFQETAARMKRKPYSPEEMQEANALRERLMAENDVDFKSRNGWARKYIGGTKFEKIQAAAGLEQWRSDYALASRDVHSDFRQMHALLAMSKIHPDVLLVGPSDTGIVEPAHSAAITLMQATVAFIFARNGDPDTPIDFSASVVIGKVLQRLTDEVGRVFMDLHEKRNEVHP